MVTKSDTEIAAAVSPAKVTASAGRAPLSMRAALAAGALLCGPLGFWAGTEIEHRRAFRAAAGLWTVNPKTGAESFTYQCDSRIDSPTS